MKLDKLPIFSGAFLWLVIVCHAMQDENDAVQACSTAAEAYSSANSAAVEAYFAAAGVYFAAAEAYSSSNSAAAAAYYAASETYFVAADTYSSANFAAAEAYFSAYEAYSGTNCAAVKVYCADAERYFNVKNWLKAIEKYTLAAEICALDAIAFQQASDAANAIEAYKYAAMVCSRIAVIARKANLLTQAIEASIKEARLYKRATQLCTKVSNIATKILLYTLAAAAYARVAGIHRNIAANYSDNNDPIHEASALLMAANAHRKSANSFRSAGNMGNAIDMHMLAAEACTIAANIFKAAKSFDEEAEAWMQAAEASALSAWTYRQIDDALNGADMYAFAASNYIAATKAYKKAIETESAIKAHQQAVTWLTIAAQIYHDAWAHESEAKEYIKIAHLLFTLNEHAQAGAAFELAAQAYQHARNYHAAVATFQAAEQAYTVASDLTAIQRMQNAVVACDLTTRNLYHEATARLLAKRTALNGETELHIDRIDLLQDSCATVMALTPTEALHTKCKIVFLDEMGDDLGGPTREWFSLLSNEMVSPPHVFFISRNPNDQTYQPNPKKNSPEDLKYYRFFGRVLAMAINSGSLVHFRLTDAFLKHMLGQPVVFEDLCTFDPVLYRSYVALKRMTDLSDMDLCFSIHTNGETIELCPNGNSLPVTLENRDEYIRLVTNYYLTTQIQPQLNAFLDGFNDFVHRDCIATLNTRALTWLISGESTLSVDDWEHNTLYEDCSATSEQVVWFWNTVHSFSPEQRAKLLHFATGSSLVPLGGFSKLDPRFTIAKINQGEDHVPSAATCFRKLNLPNYSSEEILRRKLLYAIEEGRVSFGFT